MIGVSDPIRERLSKMGISPRKELGQNFLVSPQVIGKIVEAVGRHPFTELVEIGPGVGAITEPMLERGWRPRLIEIDDDLAAYWSGRGFEVTHHDALKVDWRALGGREDTLLVSNLPYQISTHLVIDRCFGPESIRWMVLMFQKEVAQRLMAATRTKEYGQLSVMAQLHFKMKKVVDAAPGDFFPAPKIASRVLHFERLPVSGLGEPFHKFVKHAFAFRRKFMLKNLKGVVDKSVLARLPAIFAEQGLSEKARAEELTPSQFEKLFRALHEHKDHRGK